MTRSRKFLTARRFWHSEHPFLDLPLSLPEAELESRAVLKSCIEARAAVAERKQAAELIPNQAVLINTLPLLEAQASSEIENIVTTTDKLFQFRNDDSHADSATREALRYGRALIEGFHSLQRRPVGREKLFVHPRLITLLTRDSNEWQSCPSESLQTRGASKASRPGSSGRKSHR